HVTGVQTCALPISLVKAIMSEIDFEGRCQLGHGALIGYFAQNQASLLDGDLTVFQTIDQIAEGDIRTKIKDILGAFMFSGDAIEKKVKMLSGGERTRDRKSTRLNCS